MPFDAVVLIAALVVGFIAGWVVGARVGIRMPNVLVSSVVLVAGSLGGPVLAFSWLGAHRWSHALALVLAGAAAGVTFWPMGQRQGQRQWL